MPLNKAAPWTLSTSSSHTGKDQGLRICTGDAYSGCFQIAGSGFRWSASGKLLIGPIVAGRSQLHHLIEALGVSGSLVLILQSSRLVGAKVLGLGAWKLHCQMHPSAVDSATSFMELHEALHIASVVSGVGEDTPRAQNSKTQAPKHPNGGVSARGF